MCNKLLFQRFGPFNLFVNLELYNCFAYLSSTYSYEYSKGEYNKWDSLCIAPVWMVHGKKLYHGSSKFLVLSSTEEKKLY